LEAVATAFFNPGWSYPAIWLTIILFGATAIGWNGIYLAETARLAPEGQVGMATGGTLFFTFLGVAVGPPIFAAIVASTGSYPLGFIIFAILTFACGMAVILFRDKKSN
jgi:MFS family permease